MIGTRYSPKSEINSILMDENPRITSTHRQTRKSLTPRPTRIAYSVVLGSFYMYIIYVVVSISNSVLSILTANFPVRIEKKKFV